MYLEVNAKLYIIKSGSDFYADYKGRLFFHKNSAECGGAVYIADDTNSDTCSSNSLTSAVQTAGSTECFFQMLSLDINSYGMQSSGNDMYFFS